MLRHKDRQTNTQTDRQKVRQTDRQTKVKSPPRSFTSPPVLRPSANNLCTCCILKLSSSQSENPWYANGLEFRGSGFHVESSDLRKPSRVCYPVKDPHQNIHQDLGRRELPTVLMVLNEYQTSTRFGAQSVSRCWRGTSWLLALANRAPDPGPLNVTFP